MTNNSEACQKVYNCVLQKKPECAPLTPPPSSDIIITTQAPTESPTVKPTSTPTTLAPSQSPTSAPTTLEPTLAPTSVPTTLAPSQSPTTAPTLAPTLAPTNAPTTLEPTLAPTSVPTTLAPSLSPTSAPTNAPTTTLAPSTASPTTSFAGNLTCEVWGDPYVEDFLNDTWSAAPEKNNNLTTVYEMGNKLLIVAELNQTQNMTSLKWETYVETLYIRRNGQWTRRYEVKELCRQITPRLRSSSRDGIITGIAEDYYEWGDSEEAVIITTTCTTRGIDVLVNKKDWSPEAIEMGPLAWEQSQKDYTGDCFGTYTAYTGDDVPRFDN